MSGRAHGRREAQSAGGGGGKKPPAPTASSARMGGTRRSVQVQWKHVREMLVELGLARVHEVAEGDTSDAAGADEVFVDGAKRWRLRGRKIRAIEAAVTEAEETTKVLLSHEQRVRLRASVQKLDAVMEDSERRGFLVRDTRRALRPWLHAARLVLTADAQSVARSPLPEIPEAVTDAFADAFHDWLVGHAVGMEFVRTIADDDADSDVDSDADADADADAESDADAADADADDADADAADADAAVQDGAGPAVAESLPWQWAGHETDEGFQAAVARIEQLAGPPLFVFLAQRHILDETQALRDVLSLILRDVEAAQQTMKDVFAVLPKGQVRSYKIFGRLLKSSEARAMPAEVKMKVKQMVNISAWCAMILLRLVAVQATVGADLVEDTADSDDDSDDSDDSDDDDRSSTEAETNWNGDRLQVALELAESATGPWTPVLDEESDDDDDDESDEDDDDESDDDESDDEDDDDDDESEETDDDASSVFDSDDETEESDDDDESEESNDDDDDDDDESNDDDDSAS